MREWADIHEGITECIFDLSQCTECVWDEWEIAHPLKPLRYVSVIVSTYNNINTSSCSSCCSNSCNTHSLSVLAATVFCDVCRQPSGTITSPTGIITFLSCVFVLILFTFCIDFVQKTCMYVCMYIWSYRAHSDTIPTDIPIFWSQAFQW